MIDCYKRDCAPALLTDMLQYRTQMAHLVCYRSTCNSDLQPISDERLQMFAANLRGGVNPVVCSRITLANVLMFCSAPVV